MTREQVCEELRRTLVRMGNNILTPQMTLDVVSYFLTLRETILDEIASDSDEEVRGILII